MERKDFWASERKERLGLISILGAPAAAGESVFYLYNSSTVGHPLFLVFRCFRISNMAESEFTIKLNIERGFGCNCCYSNKPQLIGLKTFTRASPIGGVDDIRTGRTTHKFSNAHLQPKQALQGF